MYYKVIGTALTAAPRNFTLPDGRRVFNFDRSPKLLTANGYTETIVDGEPCGSAEWYEQDGLTITRHPFIPPEPDDTEVAEDAGA